MMRSNTQRVYRPLGLNIAILAGMVLYGLWPLAKFYVAWRWNSGFEEDGAILGALVPFDTLTILTGLLGLIVMLTGVLAWIGKPARIQYIFQGAAVITTVVLIGEAVYRVNTPDDTYGVIYSQEQTFATALQCQVPFLILLTIYIMWYCNRAPARAFYRQEPLKHWQASDE